MKKGFTLAEVLITLAIIGVVAAITLPTIMQDGRKQQLGAKLAKFQSNIEKITRGYAVEQDLTKDVIKEALEQELLFGSNNCDLTDYVTCGLRDGVWMRLAGKGSNELPANADPKNGDVVAVVDIRPNIPGLDGQDSFLFVITSKGFVLPSSRDNCLQKIAEKNYKATSVFNNTNCPSLSSDLINE